MSRLKQLVTRLRRPDMREVAVAQVSDKYSEYPSNGLTPVKLAEILREADAGDVLRQMELFEEMEEKDPHLFSQLQTRKNAVTGLDFEVIPFGDEPLDKEIADFIEEQLNGIESFEDVENDLLDAIGKGFAVSEILWGYDEGHVVVQDIKTRHQKRFFWDTLDDSFKVRTKDVPEGILLPANKFIVHRYKARSGHTSRAGILRVVAWMYLFKNYDLKDWVSFAEIYGLPLRLGKYAPGASDSDKAALMRALIQIGSDAAGIIPDGTSIDFITTEKTSSSDLYERLARYCDEQISKAILGQTLTSDSGGGSYAQSKTHNDVRHDLTVADCKALASTLRRDLIRPLCIFNFGEDKRIPYIRFDCEESEDLTQTATILGTLIEKVGLRILYNKCEWFRNAVNSVINFFKETLTAVGSVAKSVFEGIGNVIGSVMDAAKATVSEKLSNIKTAYEEHGGGISGVAAAAMEAVKGWYTAGYTFIDNLTGGKLSEIRGKFSTAMSNIVQGISQKFTDARTAFSNGLNNIKNAVSGAVTWFFESGKRIVSTFANGIKSAFSSAVEAVKGGLQKIRNLLPFSDAKEGPLSTLTLSGQRTMTTYAHGLTLAGDAPAEAMNKSLQQVQGALDRKPEKKVDLGGGKKDKDESSDEGSSGKGKQVIIHKLLVPVDLKKIKDLQQLLALLQEVEDYAAANEDGEPGDDEDAVPAPA